MSEQRTLDYEIENVGGVEYAKLSLSPGVNVLRGRNAAGKTSAIRAVVRAQGGKESLERRDGSEHGKVVGPGVALTVRQVVKTTGHAEMSLADTGPLARLIDPQLKSTDAAAKERMRALAELLQMSVDDEILRQLSSKDERLFNWLQVEVREKAIDDVVLAAEVLRHGAHAFARDLEQTASIAEGQEISAGERAIEILAKFGGDVGRLPETSVEIAQAAFDDAIRQHERATTKCESREELESRQKEIKDSMAAPPDIDASCAHADLLDDKLTAAQRRVKTLQAELKEAEKIEATLTAEHRAAREKLDRDRKLESEQKWQRELLAKPLEGPTRQDVEGMRVDLVEKKRAELGLANNAAEYRREAEAQDEARREKEAAKKEADRLRGLASAIPHRLGLILKEAGAPGLTVANGRLQAIVDGEAPRDFEKRCSDGERVSIALDVAAAAYKGKVLPLAGDFWMSLDPANKARFAAMAKERGLFVVTEEPTDGDLRVEKIANTIPASQTVK